MHEVMQEPGSTATATANPTTAPTTANPVDAAISRGNATRRHRQEVPEEEMVSYLPSPLKRRVGDIRKR